MSRRNMNPKQFLAIAAVEIARREQNPDAITYHDLERGQIAVYLGRKRVGVIKRRDGIRPKGKPGFQYVPLGQRQGGEVFPTLAECKRSLEEADSVVKCQCGHSEPLSAYAIAQTAMGHSVNFTCPKCSHVTKITP